MMRMDWRLPIILLALVLGSCGVPQAGTELPPSDPQVAATERLPETPVQLGRTPEPTEMPSTPPVEKFVELSKQDLANRLGIDIERITLVRTAEMLWLNAALGCPRPGVFYPAGRVPGFQIWLDIEGTEYVYNTDLHGTLVLCQELNPDVPNLDTGPTPGVPIR